MINIHVIVAARPNFMKVAPVYHALAADSLFSVKLLHTGQHYDSSLSDQLMAELSLPAPYCNFHIGSGSHAQQTAKVLTKYESFLQEDRPDLCIVPGDVNSTLACSLAAVKLNVPVAHLESGLRSFDRTMPEEINRVLTDQISSILWTPSEDADVNLLAEGIPRERISRVGNCMIDSLVALLPNIRKRRMCEQFALQPQEYCVVTLHRPSNVDNHERLEAITEQLCVLAESSQIVFPVHPRTLVSLERTGLLAKLDNLDSITLTGPLGYLDFLSLVESAKAIVTDSGGIQEETSYLGIPCLTLRPNTERPVTCSLGTNRLVEPESLVMAYDEALSVGKTDRTAIPLWDGKSGSRIARDIKNRLLKK